MLDLISIRLEANDSYELGDPIAFTIHIKNNTHVPLYMLGRSNPLEGMISDHFQVLFEGKLLPYDGMLLKRTSDIHPTEYHQLAADEEKTIEVALHKAYPINKPGRYEVRLHGVLEDIQTAASAIQPRRAHHNAPVELQSDPIRFKVAGAEEESLPTEGRIARQNEGTLSTKDADTIATESYGPKTAMDPTITNGTPEQEVQVLEAHRAAAVYTWAVTQLLQQNDHYVTWFGAQDDTRFAAVKSNYQKIYDALIGESLTYNCQGPKCGENTFAYTYKGTKTVYLCGAFWKAGFGGEDSKIGTLIHEWSHAIAYTDDYKYGRGNCKQLAKDNPAQAIDNADSYEYYAETTLPINAKMDCSATLPNGKLYITLGNIYFRYSDQNGGQIDHGYPLPLQGNWGILPAEFAKGFDSMSVWFDGKKTYVTKGGQCIRYSDSYGTVVDPDYPQPINARFGNVPAAFAEGFDSMAVLGNGKAYVTKGGKYIRYENGASQPSTTSPRSIAGSWGNLDDQFKAKFDSIMILPNGKLYVSSGKNYIRYKDTSGNVVDSGYPKPIEGNWGTAPDS